MSVVVTKVFSDRIVMAADSQLTYMDTKSITPKLIHGPNLTLGLCGPADQLTKMKAHLAVEGNDIVSPTIEGVHDFFTKFDAYMYRNHELERQWHIVTQGKAFTYIEGNIIEIVNFDAIGSGRDNALTALWLGCTPFRAVEAAINFNIFCGGPVQEVTIAK